jgi:hypothetical protein
MKLESLLVIQQVLNAPSVTVPFGEARVAARVLDDLDEEIAKAKAIQEAAKKPK